MSLWSSCRTNGTSPSFSALSHARNSITAFNPTDGSLTLAEALRQIGLALAKGLAAIAKQRQIQVFCWVRRDLSMRAFMHLAILNRPARYS